LDIYDREDGDQLELKTVTNMFDSHRGHTYRFAIIDLTIRSWALHANSCSKYQLLWKTSGVFSMMAWLN